MSTWMSKSKLYKRVCTCVDEAEHGTLNILNTHCQSKSSSWEKISTERPISKKIKWIWKCPISEVVNVKIKIKIKTIQECLYKALSILSTHCQCPVFAVIAPLTRNKQYGNDDLLNCDEDDTWERLALRVRKCVWGEFMELYLSCKWIPGLRNTSGELVVNWPESCPRSAEPPHSHNFILLDFLISSWFTFSFTRMYLNFYGPFRIQITEDRDIWRKYLKYFKEEVGEI